MSSNRELNILGLLERLRGYFLSPDSPSQLEIEGKITKEERIFIDGIKNTELPPNWRPKEDSTDSEILAYIINKLKEAFSIEPFDQQLLALVRAIKNYHDPNERGLVLEMKTGEGKSSVVIPMLISYFYFKGERVQIHEINPYLLHESYQRFLDFARILGIKDDEVGLLTDYKDEERIMKKRIVYGLWPTFIHHHQNQFLSEEREEEVKKPPILILDEVDQILNEEAMAPAIIAREMVDSASILDNYRQDLISWYSDENKDESKGKPLVLEINIGDQSYQILINPNEVLPNKKNFASYIKWFFKRMEVLEENYSLKNRSEEEKRDFFSTNLSFDLFRSLVFSKLNEKIGIEGLTEEQIKDINRQIKSAFDSLPFSFWWDNPGFQNHLITAFLLKRGVDYQVKEKDGQKSIFLLSPTTGYPEKGKEYETIVSLFLYLKEKLDLPEKVIGEEVDWMPVLSYYCWVLDNQGKIFGFTGTASPVARRIRDVYGLPTSLINEHFKTQREVKEEIFEDGARRLTRLVEIVVNSPQNTLIVVETPEEAEKIRSELEGIQNISVNMLSAQNEDQDFNLYQWLSTKKEGERKVLICVKMIGRGVDLKPDETIKKEGFLLIVIPPKYQRSLWQVIGRVGRRGEKGLVYILISPEDEVFSYLSTERQEELKRWFREKNYKKVYEALREAWNYWEDEITERMRYWMIFYKPIARLRAWLRNEINLGYFEERLRKKGIIPDQLRNYLKSDWSGILAYLRETFNFWLAAGKIGPFGQGDPNVVWTNFVFDNLPVLYGIMNNEQKNKRITTEG